MEVSTIQKQTGTNTCMNNLASFHLACLQALKVFQYVSCPRFSGYVPLDPVTAGY